MGFGDGRLIAETLHRALEVVTRYLQGTDGRGSLFLIWGGLVTIGFLTATHFFRTVVLGDLAPAANTPGSGSSPAHRPRVLTSLRPPPEEVEPTKRAQWDPATARRLGKIAGRRVGIEDLDDLFDAFHAAGLGDARILMSSSGFKRVRVYPARPEGGSSSDCQYAEGFLQGGLEVLVAGPVEAQEIACRHEGDAACEFTFTYGGVSG